MSRLCTVDILLETFFICLCTGLDIKEKVTRIVANSNIKRFQKLFHGKHTQIKVWICYPAVSCRQKVELKVLGTKPDVLAITTQKQHTVTTLF